MPGTLLITIMKEGSTTRSRNYLITTWMTINNDDAAMLVVYDKTDRNLMIFFAGPGDQL